MLKKSLFVLIVFIIFFLSGCTGLTPAVPPVSSPPGSTPTEPAATPTQTPQKGTPSQVAVLPTLTLEALPSATAEPTATALPYSPQLGSPQYLPAFTQPESGCNWVGIAGQVFDSQTNPVENVTVVVKGLFNGKAVDGMALSGLGKAYGPGGYEVKLGDKATDTNGAVTVQLFNAQFAPLSDSYSITTYNDCQKNLIIFNFQSIMAVQKVFLPSVVR